MERYNFQAYIVPLDDQGRREWISGFTGSNGDCVVTKDKVIYSMSKCCINQPYFIMLIQICYMCHTCVWQIFRRRCGLMVGILLKLPNILIVTGF